MYTALMRLPDSLTVCGQRPLTPQPLAEHARCLRGSCSPLIEILSTSREIPHTLGETLSAARRSDRDAPLGLAARVVFTE